ncbi:unnamed protein product [Lepeophtheirus salmonis]|uniref:(salmon louse) hypothetical protein n=1 Tax=Lepeophtheirus salmonis TaxID=72036 RepID=A0A7R8CFQ4_LEPSM|nr:unnamed protein product [Lepeophtheirus salmonis]CAF2808618.1 unnamed protein product [Lepeophtheirus salmonis]
MYFYLKKKKRRCSPSINTALQMDEGNHCMSINYKTPVENAKEILLVNAYTDLIFCFSDGRRLRAHKVILSEFSPLIRKICSEHSPLSEIYISIDEEEYESLNIILSLIYVGYSSTCITETSFFLRCKTRPALSTLHSLM